MRSASGRLKRQRLRARSGAGDEAEFRGAPRKRTARRSKPGPRPTMTIFLPHHRSRTPAAVPRSPDMIGRLEAGHDHFRPNATETTFCRHRLLRLRCFFPRDQSREHHCIASLASVANPQPLPMRPFWYLLRMSRYRDQRTGCPPNETAPPYRSKQRMRRAMPDDRCRDQSALASRWTALPGFAAAGMTTPFLAWVSARATEIFQRIEPQCL